MANASPNDKELTTFGFVTNKLRTGLITALLAAQSIAIVVLFAKYGDAKDELVKKQDELYKAQIEYLREPVKKMNQASEKVSSTAEKVDSVANKVSKVLSNNTHKETRK